MQESPFKNTKKEYEPFQMRRQGKTVLQVAKLPPQLAPLNAVPPYIVRTWIVLRVGRQGAYHLADNGFRMGGNFRSPCVATFLRPSGNRKEDSVLRIARYCASLLRSSLASLRPFGDRSHLSTRSRFSCPWMVISTSRATMVWRAREGLIG